jgi:type II secretory pathway component PulM
MMAVVQRYKAVFIVLVLMALMALLYWFIFKPDSEKIPSRGIFVIDCTEQYCNIYSTI